MSDMLNAADRAAIEILLSQNGKSGYIAPAASPSKKRLAAAQQWLDLLGSCPAEDPPADLAARTLRYIARATLDSATGEAPRPLPPRAQPGTLS